ncbi:MAG: hypothetical protein ABIO29_01025 [Sphingomicrobium sp.]
MRARSAYLLAAIAVSTLGVAAPLAAQGSYSPYNETATAALARYVRALSVTPRDFTLLISAGRAALEVGDVQAAAGFFARADEEQPKGWQPQAGMGAVAVANGEPLAALPYFTRAQQLGASLPNYGADRGLAYDLLGRQSEAQSDYRAAQAGADRDTATARLALSLAISGKRDEALAVLVPLMAKRDPAGGRARAFVLALAGDATAARATFDSVVPGSAASISPFLARLPSLSAGQKAAAVNLGMFPEGDEPSYDFAAAAPPTTYAPAPRSSPAIATVTPPAARSAAASGPLTRASAPQPRSSAAAKKVWLQLASGSNKGALSSQFATIKSKHSDLFDGIHGYVAQAGSSAKLVIGPFRTARDADMFAADLESVDVNAFKWNSSESDLIVPLGTN